MEESSRKSTYMRPMTLAEMMPNLGGILPESEMVKLTARKAAKKTGGLAHTTGKDFRPCLNLTMAQLRAEIQALKPKGSPARGRVPPSVLKKWNTSTKCENKKTSHTANNATKHLNARKILNFQPPPKLVINVIWQSSGSSEDSVPLKTDRTGEKLEGRISSSGRIHILINRKEAKQISNSPIYYMGTECRAFYEKKNWKKLNMSNIPRPSMKPTFITPKLIKSEKRANKILKHLEGKNPIRISGISNIQETPAAMKPDESIKFNVDNKENLPKSTNFEQNTLCAFDESFRQLIGNKKVTPKASQASRKSVIVQQRKENKETQTTTEKIIPKIQIEKSVHTENLHETSNVEKHKNVDMNESFIHLQCKKRLTTIMSSPTEANSEQSFLEQEKEIYNETVKDARKVFEDSPLVSTPFKKYRDVEEYFNDSSDFEDSSAAANITNFDKTSMEKLQDSKEECDIVSLCDLMDKAKVTHDNKSTEKYKIELLKMQSELESEKRFILMSLKRNEFMLKSVKKLLNLKHFDEASNEASSVQNPDVLQQIQARIQPPTTHLEIAESSDRPKTVIRRVSKSPSYKIPKHSPCLRKRALYKSVPVDLNWNPVTPKPKTKAMNVYLKMKEQCNFLMTPVANKTLPAGNIPNTPAITSLNLQSQLEKLYDETP